MHDWKRLLDSVNTYEAQMKVSNAIIEESC